MHQSLATQRRRANSRSDHRSKKLLPAFRSHRLVFESLEPRQMLSATPLSFQVLNDATANLSYQYSDTGAPQGSTTLAAANAAPRGVASTVGVEKTWVIDANRNVYVYNTSGVLQGSWSAGSMASNATPEGIATNGTDLWIVDGRSDKVFYSAGAASRLSGSQNAASSFSLASGNANPKDMVSDGASLWIVDDVAKTDKVFKYSTTGAFVGSWTIDSANKTPTGIALDPANIGDMWIVDSGTDRVYKYTAAASRNAGSQTASATFALAAGNGNPQGIVVPGRPWAEMPHQVEWVRQLGSAGDEIGLGVAADGSGNVYLSGRTNGSLAAPNTSGLEVPVLAQYDTDGNSTWVQQQDAIPGVGYSGVRVEADSLGNVFQVENGTNGASLSNYDAAGTLRWTTALPSGEQIYGVAADDLGYAYTSSYAGSSVYMRKFDGLTGNIVWTQTLETGAGAGSFGVSADGLGNIYVSGYTSGSVIGPNSGGYDGFVAKYSDAGDFLWARQFGSAGTEYAWDIAADTLGNVYTVGQTNGSLGAANAGGEFDVFVTKHDAAGNLQWIRQLGTSADESLNGVWADASGNAYVTGWIRGALGGAHLGESDSFTAKYDPAGNLLWSQQLGTSGRDSTNDVFGDAFENVYLGGNTRGSWAAPNAGGADFVLIKLTPPAAATRVTLQDSPTVAAALSAPTSIISSAAVSGSSLEIGRGSESRLANRTRPASRIAFANAGTNSAHALDVLRKAAKAKTRSTDHAADCAIAVDAALAEMNHSRWPKILAEILPGIC